MEVLGIDSDDPVVYKVVHEAIGEVALAEGNLVRMGGAGDGGDGNHNEDAAGDDGGAAAGARVK